MIKNFFYTLFLIFSIIFLYLTLLFDVNKHKASLERMISEQANIDFKVLGDLSLNLGTDTIIRAKQLSIKKNNSLLLESEEFNASVSITQILTGRFDVNSLSLKNSKLYGLNIDESVIKIYNAIAGRSYTINNTAYSNIEIIEAEGYYQNDMLQIKNIKLKTELLEGNGIGKINPVNETINISAATFIQTNDNIKKKYNKYYPIYLVDTQLPIIISGNYNSPDIDIKISDVLSKKLREQIKEKTIKSIKDKIRDKIQSEINIKLPF